MEQPLKTYYDIKDTTFLVSMVTFKALSISASTPNKGHFTTCRDTIYTFFPQNAAPRCCLSVFCDQVMAKLERRTRPLVVLNNVSQLLT